MGERSYNRSLLGLGIIAAVVLALDQVTKVLVRRYLPLHTSWNPVEWLEPFVTLTHIQNTGAAFGLFPGLSLLFMMVAMFVVVGIILYYRRVGDTSRWLRWAMGLQLAGATGNLVDRLLYGHVTDFVDLGWFPIFNVADSAITVGTTLLVIYILFIEGRPVPSAEPAPCGTVCPDPDDAA